MSAYMPKVGDKVRATLGETRIVGTVTVAYDHRKGVDVLAEGARGPTECWDADGWQFEQIVSVPTKFGAVIRRADGTLFVRSTAGPHDPSWSNADYLGLNTLDATEDGFTVLFDGVDE